MDSRFSSYTIAGMKHCDPKSIWPEDLVRYKEILDNNPNYAVLAEEDKVRIADRIMHSTYADLTDNWAFKWVFLNNPDQLIMLLKDILEEDIIDIEYLPNDALSATLTDKQAAMDVTCKTSDGRQFVVEMQTNRKTDFKNRLFYYGASAIHRQVKAGSKKYIYDSVRVIAILDFITKHSDEPKDKILFHYEFLESETKEIACICWSSLVCRKRSRTRTILKNGAICSGIFLNLSAYRRKLILAFTN